MTYPANQTDDSIAQAQDKHRLRERFLVSLVVMLALIANTPAHVLLNIGIAREIIIAVLGILIVLALFLYLRFFFFLLYVLLTIGANLPEHWAQTLGIARAPLLIALVCMVAGSSLNYLGNFMPTGMGIKSRRNNPEALQALIAAIERQQRLRVHSILEIDFDIDHLTEKGETALIYAARLGNPRIVHDLLEAGAKPDIIGPEGSALDYARGAGHGAVVALLSNIPSTIKRSEIPR